jgi:hypothetical protein
MSLALQPSFIEKVEEMLHRWLKKYSKGFVGKRALSTRVRYERSTSGLYFGCAWCPHPIGSAYVLIDVRNSKLPSRTHGCRTLGDLNP